MKREVEEEIEKRRKGEREESKKEHKVPGRKSNRSKRSR